MFNNFSDIFYVQHIPAQGTMEDRYLLLTQSEHFCFAASDDISKVTGCAGRYVQKYRTKNRLLDMIDHTITSSGMTSPSVKESRQEWFDLHADDYKDVLNAAIEEAIQYNKENSPLRRTMKRLKKVKHVPQLTAQQEVAKEVIPSRPVKPHILPRKRPAVLA